VDLFGDDLAENLIGAHGSVILLSAVAARDEKILIRPGNHQPVNQESSITFS